jgi:hypothetical protein
LNFFPLIARKAISIRDTRDNGGKRVVPLAHVTRMLVREHAPTATRCQHPRLRHSSAN